MTFVPPPPPPQFPYQPWEPPPAAPPPLPHQGPPAPLEKERSRVGIVLAWVVIFACVGLIVGRSFLFPDKDRAHWSSAGEEDVEAPATARHSTAATRPAGSVPDEESDEPDD